MILLTLTKEEEEEEEQKENMEHELWNSILIRNEYIIYYFKGYLIQ
jgi:hypothetical protein